MSSRIYRKLPYDTVKDFASVSLIANGAYILATNTALPVKSVSDLVSFAKARPGDRLSRETAKAVAAEDIKDKLINLLGLDPVGSTPAELDAVIGTELKKWNKVIKVLGISAES